MWEVILLSIFGIGFLAIGIRHNKKIHSEEGFGDTFSGSIIIDMILGKLTELVDKLPYWFAKSLYLKIITGREVGEFAPNGQLTRAEMTVIIQRMLKLEGTVTLQFKDVASTHWAYSSIQAIIANKLASGYPDDTFKPDNSISRAEFAKILSESIQ